MRIFTALAVLLGLCTLAPAQPVDALLQDRGYYGSTLYWLRPDGSYIVLRSAGQISALPPATRRAESEPTL